MKFSGRLPHDLHPNALTELLREKRQAGARVLDLTESNPTHAGIEYPAGFLASLGTDAALRYEPEPFGLPAARETIAREYGAAGGSCGDDGQHERGVFVAVQAALRSR